MRPPLFVRPLTDAERQALTAGRRSSAAFILRRGQILRASTRGERAPRIAPQLGCDDQTVLDARHAFTAPGLAALQGGSSRPHQPPPQAFPGERAEQLRARTPQSARVRPSDPSVDPGPGGRGELRRRLDPHGRQGRSPPQAFEAPGHRLEARRAGDYQPRPGGRPNTRQRARLIALAAAHPEWALGFADEGWWSRLAPPHLPAWAAGDQPRRLVDQTVAQAAPDPKALAGYGLLVRRAQQDEAVWRRFVDGRPVSARTTQFLEWGCPKLEARGVPGWGLIGDHACWPVSQAVRAWLRAHNRAVKPSGQGVRLLVCYLPVKRPWLHPIDPQWVQSKRAIVEPTRLLSAQEGAERVCASHACPLEPHLTLPDPDPVLDTAS